MNGVCENVRALLAARLDGALPEDRARQVDAHLAVCADCAELAAALQLGREGLAGAPSADLTGPVLAATSGPACPRCRAALAARAEGGLAGAEAALVEGHLEHCDACRAVAEVLDWLPAVLPTLAEVEAGEDFVDEVLRRTSRAPLPLWRRLGREAAARLRRLSQRPLFPVEAAYVATLVAVLLFGTGVSPLRQAPQRALDWLRGEDVAAPRVAGAPVLRDLGATGGRLADEAGGAARHWRGRLFRAVENRATRAWDGAVELGEGLRGAGHALLGHEGYELTPSLGRVGQGFQTFWVGLTGAGSKPPDGRGPPPAPEDGRPAEATAGG